MGFWLFMLVCDLLVPVIMILCGQMMWKHAPGKINGVMGYRTSRSMKNMDTWKFAHDYCGRLWWKIGWIMLILSFIIHIPIYGRSDDVIGWTGGILTMLQCVVLIASIIPTEMALKKAFTKEGIRREV